MKTAPVTAPVNPKALHEQIFTSGSDCLDCQYSVTSQPVTNPKRSCYWRNTPTKCPAVWREIAKERLR